MKNRPIASLDGIKDFRNYYLGVNNHHHPERWFIMHTHEPAFVISLDQDPKTMETFEQFKDAITNTEFPAISNVEGYQIAAAHMNGWYFVEEEKEF